MRALPKFKTLKTLRARLALFLAVAMTCVLLAFGGSMYAIAVSVEAEEDEPLAEKEHELADSRRRLGIALAIALPLAIGLAVVGSMLLARRAFRSLEEVIRVARELEIDHLDARIDVIPNSGAEIEQLAQALNGMLARMERAIGGLRRFTSDAAHELRTPLAALMARIEICLRHPRDVHTLRTTLEESLEELGQLQRLVDGLLMLARADAGGLKPVRQRLDLGELLRHAIDVFEPVALERALSLRLHADRSCTILADSMPVRRILVNLLDNACKFTPAGGAIDVRLTVDAAAAQVRITDSGPGISAAERGRIFDRFYRSDRVRGESTGFGLGLAIARELAHSVGASLALESSPDGQPGACFVLTFATVAGPAESAELADLGPVAPLTDGVDARLDGADRAL